MDKIDQGDVFRPEPQHMRKHEHLVGLPVGVHHGVAVGDRHAERLLQQNVLSRLQGGNRESRVQVRWKRIADGLDGGIVDDRHVVCRGPRPNFLSQLLSFG